MFSFLIIKQRSRDCRINGTTARQRFHLCLRKMGGLRKGFSLPILDCRSSLRVQGRRGLRVLIVLQGRRDLAVPVDRVTLLLNPHGSRDWRQGMQGKKGMRE
nr:hypothetical protein I308_03171 [Cryptococcus tetragattii IND107]